MRRMPRYGGFNKSGFVETVNENIVLYGSGWLKLKALRESLLDDAKHRRSDISTLFCIRKL